MQVLSKRERDMNEEEKIRLDFIRTWLIAEDGVILREPSVNIDLTDNCKKAKTLDIILKKFNISYKNPEDAKNFFPEKEITYPGQTLYHQIMDSVEEARKINKVADTRNKNMKLSMINEMEKIMVKKEDKTEKKQSKPKAEKIEKSDETEE